MPSGPTGPSECRCRAPGEAAGIPVASYETLYAAVKEYGGYR